MSQEKTVNVIEKPSRRTIERLLRELESDARWDRDDQEYQKASHAADALEDELKKNPELRRLKKLESKLYQALQETSHARKNLVAHVRRLYLANGLTPYVQEEMNKVLLLFRKPRLTYHVVKQLEKDAEKLLKKSKKKK